MTSARPRNMGSLRRGMGSTITTYPFSTIRPLKTTQTRLNHLTTKMCEIKTVLRLDISPYYFQDSIITLNIARIANAVQCHNQLSGHKDCHEFRFSIVRILVSVSNVTSLQDCSQEVFSKCLCHCLCICICICLCQFFGHVMSSHHSEQMPQRSQCCLIILRSEKVNLGPKRMVQ